MNNISFLSDCNPIHNKLDEAITETIHIIAKQHRLTTADVIGVMHNIEFRMLNNLYNQGEFKL